MDTKHLKRNNTTLFLLPLLGQNKQVTIDDHLFINSYIGEGELVIKYNEWDDIKVPFNNAIKETINYFIKGHYSQIPNQHKQTILNFWDLSKGSKIHSILYPKSFFYEAYGISPKKVEIWPKPNIEEETI